MLASAYALQTWMALSGSLFEADRQWVYFGTVRYLCGGSRGFLGPARRAATGALMS